MNKKQKKMLVRIIVSAAMMIILKFTPVEGILRFLLYLIPYFIIGYDVLKKAGKGILNRQVFDENFLMAVATIGAMAVALYNGSESAAALSDLPVKVIIPKQLPLCCFTRSVSFLRAMPSAAAARTSAT